jgi:nitroreductase
MKGIELMETVQLSVLDAIHRRRSIGKMTGEMPPREAIEQVLDAAIQAPNHHLTEPWRFFVLAGDARLELGDAMVRARLASEPNPDDVPALVLEKLRQKPLRAPVIIAVAVQPQPGAKVVEIEEICSGAAAAQNMLLAAEAIGLAAMWRTGDACFSDEIKKFFGLDVDDHLLGFIYLGYAAIDVPPRQRTPAREFTLWRGF